MPTPTAITDLSQTAASNFPQGSDSPSSLDDVQRAHGSFIAQLRDGKNFTNPVALASAATTDIGAQNALSVEISGAVTITSFGTSYNGPRFLRFTGALVLTHSSTLNLPGAANITTVAGDTCVAIPTQGATGWNILAYQRSANTAGLATTATNLAAGSIGTVPYQSAAGATAMLAVGTSGQVLTSAGASAPTWTTISTVPADGSITPAKLSQPATLGTAQATTSGTALDFTGIPSWVKKITVMFRGVKTSGTSVKQIQLGSGSIETTGYNSCGVGYTGAAMSAVTRTGGFGFNDANISTDPYDGSFIFTQLGSNQWVLQGSGSCGGTSSGWTSSGAKTLAGVLDRVRLTTLNGTDTFTAGSWNILYE